MTVTHEEVIDMYLKDKLSVQQIADELAITPYKTRKILLEEGIQIRTRREASRNLYITKHGYVPFELMNDLTPELERLKVAGVMLYWGEGAKRGGVVALSNSDPAMVKVFLRFLRLVCGIDPRRLHISIHYYPDHDIGYLTDFWSEVTDVPVSQFYKPFLHGPGTGTYRTFSRYGTIIVRYADTLLLEQILRWMKEYETLGEPISS